MYSKTLSVIVVVALMVSAIPAMATQMDVSDSGNLFSSSNTLAVSPLHGVSQPVTVLLDDQAGSAGDDYRILFGNDLDDQFLSISGFSAPNGVAKIRIFTIHNEVYYKRNLPFVTIKSSTSLKSTLVSADYETLLGTDLQLSGVAPNFTIGTYYNGATAPNGTNDSYVYFDVAISAPAGTQSFLFDFGRADDSGPTDTGDGDRIYEVQAFAIPEPGTLALLATGLIGLLCYAWRNRK